MVHFKIGLVSTSQLSFPGDKKTAFENSVEGMKKLAAAWNFLEGKPEGYPGACLVRQWHVQERALNEEVKWVNSLGENEAAS